MKKLLLLFLLIPVFVLYSNTNRPHQPKLAVFIVVDQMRYDYLERFQDHFSENGFNYFLKKGANYTNCNYAQYNTYTAAGHAVLGTGAWAGENGITGNYIFKRNDNTTEYCVNDPNYTNAETPEISDRDGRKSTKNLTSVSLSAAIKSHNPKSKVFSVSAKDRAAVLMGGDKADAAYWYSRENGHFITSTYYRPDLPDWAKIWNSKSRAGQWFNTEWSYLLDKKVYDAFGPDSFASEETPDDLSNTFPHRTSYGSEKPDKKYFGGLLATPFGDILTMDFARDLIVNEELGQDNDIDLLNLSLSCTDYIGHAYGPDSQEMMDNMIRTDRLLNDFIMYLDKTIGLNNTAIFISADHGIAPFPELMREKGVDAGRINSTKIFNEAEKAIRSRYGNPPGDKNWCEPLTNASIFMTSEFWKRTGADSQKVQNILREAILPVEGIETVFTRQEIMKGNSDDNPLWQYVKNAYYPSRSGDVVIIQKEYWIFNYSDDQVTGTTHGSPWWYDTHVPMLMNGPGITPGTFDQPVGPNDLVGKIADFMNLNISESPGMDKKNRADTF
ncbi:MAG: alkaline phosphatase family protein [Calditrichaceae bacterium]